MKQKIRRTVAALIAATVFLSVPTAAAPAVSARCAVLMDAASGRILWEKQARTRGLIASTTKIMTGLLVTERCGLQEQVSVPAEAVGVEGSSMGLQQGQILTVEALLYGLLLQSGNDAAVALAIHCSGSEEAFVREMNQKARDLGLTGTSFANPHGLDAENHYGTALDLARLAAAAMEQETFRTVVSAKTAVVGERTLQNHNKLLWTYEGAIGVKTGYTRAAGRILVSCAQRQGRRLIAVTLDGPNDWEDHRALLDYGFSAFRTEEAPVSAEVPVISGCMPRAAVTARQTVTYPLAAGELLTLRYDLPPFVYAPVLAGEQAGWVHVLVNGTEQQRLPLFWRETVMEGA